MGVVGDVKRAEEQFRIVYDRATKGQSGSKKKYLFGALVGMVSRLLPQHSCTVIYALIHTASVTWSRL